MELKVEVYRYQNSYNYHFSVQKAIIIAIMDNIVMLRTEQDICNDLAKRLKQLRRKKRISQKRLSVLSGVPLASIKVFEEKGKVSLLSFVKIATALGESSAVDDLFVKEGNYESIEEVIDANNKARGLSQR